MYPHDYYHIYLQFEIHFIITKYIIGNFVGPFHSVPIIMIMSVYLRIFSISASDLREYQH